MNLTEMTTFAKIMSDILKNNVELIAMAHKMSLKDQRIYVPKIQAIIENTTQILKQMNAHA